jgi:TPR repeat protein
MKGEKEFNKAIEFLNKIKVNSESKEELYENYLKGVKKAAYLGYAAAQFELSSHYDDMGFWGMNNPYYNPIKKLYWLKKACQGNDPVACNNLAAMFESGEGGCKIDLDQALLLYKKAMDLGVSYAKDNYKILLKQIKINK